MKLLCQFPTMNHVIPHDREPHYNQEIRQHPSPRLSLLLSPAVMDLKVVLSAEFPVAESAIERL